MVFVSLPISTSQPSAGMLCLSLSLHLCGCITISMKASPFHLLFAFVAGLSLFLLYQLIRLWQAERPRRSRRLEAVVIPADAIQKFMAEQTKRSSFAEMRHQNDPAAAAIGETRRGSPHKCECAVCFEVMDDTKLGLRFFCWRPKPRNRALLVPCGHASLCTLCAFKLWKSTRNLCPVCRARITRKPKRLPANIHL